MTQGTVSYSVDCRIKDPTHPAVRLLHRWFGCGSCGIRRGQTRYRYVTLNTKMKAAVLLVALSAVALAKPKSHNRESKQKEAEKHLKIILRSFVNERTQEIMAKHARKASNATSPNTDDLEALVALYKSTGGPNWANKSGWEDGMNGDPCGDQWFGVYCNEENRVVMLSLALNHLVGPLPVELTKAESLESLDLFQNGLSGSIPEEIFLLPNLSEFSVDFNHLSGELPRTLDAPKLETLYLYNNFFVGALPDVWKTPKLRYFNVATNQLTGEIPTGLGDAEELLILVVSHNNLTGGFPSSLGKLTKLNKLWIFDTKVTGPLPSSWFDMVSLTDVQVEGLSGVLPDWIGDNWIKVQTLVLTRGSMTGEIPLSLCFLQDLERLWLFNHNLSGKIPNCVEDLTKLVWIDLSNNFLTGYVPSSFGSLVNMTHLSLGRNQLTGSLPDALGYMKSLESLDVCTNMLTGGIPETFNSFGTRVYEFSICFNSFSGPIPSSLEEFFRHIDDFSCLMYDNPWSCPMPSFVPKSCGCTCSPCNTGDKHVYCHSCVTSTGCGFCNNGPNCMEGNATAPFITQCPEGRWIYGSTEC